MVNTLGHRLREIQLVFIPPTVQAGYELVAPMLGSADPMGLDRPVLGQAESNWPMPPIYMSSLNVFLIKIYLELSSI